VGVDITLAYGDRDISEFAAFEKPLVFRSGAAISVLIHKPTGETQ